MFHRTLKIARFIFGILSRSLRRRVESRTGCPSRWPDLTFNVTLADPPHRLRPFFSLFLRDLLKWFFSILIFRRLADFSHVHFDSFWTGLSGVAILTFLCQVRYFWLHGMQLIIRPPIKVQDIVASRHLELSFVRRPTGNVASVVNDSHCSPHQ